MSLASLVITLAALVASMWTWRVLLAGMGSPLPFEVAARVMFVGQLGKYLPGSVWPVLAQMELATGHGVPRSRTASAGLVNMPVSLLSALLAALVTLPFTGGSTKYLWFIAATPLLLACLHPKVLNYLLGLVFKLARRPPLEQPLTGRVIAASVGWSFLSWLLYGAALWLLAIRVGIPAGTGYPLSVGAFALGFALGFVVIPAPAGAGVREVVLTHQSRSPLCGYLSPWPAMYLSWVWPFPITATKRTAPRPTSKPPAKRRRVQPHADAAGPAIVRFPPLPGPASLAAITSSSIRTTHSCGTSYHKEASEPRQ
jgi:hypothetical protein